MFSKFFKNLSRVTPEPVQDDYHAILPRELRRIIGEYHEEATRTEFEDGYKHYSDSMDKTFNDTCNFTYCTENDPINFISTMPTHFRGVDFCLAAAGAPTSALYQCGGGDNRRGDLCHPLMCGLCGLCIDIPCTAVSISAGIVGGASIAVADCTMFAVAKTKSCLHNREEARGAAELRNWIN
jgi:hypothetical protein